MSKIYTYSDLIEFFTRVFGSIEQGSGENIQVKCPYCTKEKAQQGMTNKKRKLAILLSTHVWHCWVCGNKGHIIKVLRKFAKQEHYSEYMNRFADDKMIQLQEQNEAEENLKPALPFDFKMLALHKNDSYQAKRTIKYLKDRGANERDLWYFKFGISEEYPWKDRVIMPSFDSNGDLSYYCARSIEKNPYFKYWDSELRKQHIIFNEINIDWSEELTIVEGIFDLIKCNDNAVPLLGSTLSPDSVLYKKIIENKTPILLALDSDMKNTKTPYAIKMLCKSGIQVRELELGSCEDIGSMSKKEFQTKREQAKICDFSSMLKDKINRKIFSKSLV